MNLVRLEYMIEIKYPVRNTTPFGAASQLVSGKIFKVHLQISW